MTRKQSSPPSDDLLGDKELRETKPSQPSEVEGDAVSEDRPLPLNLITQTKNHRDLLDYFLSAPIPDEGINKSDIADGAGISANGVRRHIDVFLAFGIVEEVTDEDARISRYTTNMDSDVHQALRYANDALASNYQEE